MLKWLLTLPDQPNGLSPAPGSSRITRHAGLSAGRWPTQVLLVGCAGWRDVEELEATDEAYDGSSHGQGDPVNVDCAFWGPKCPPQSKVFWAVLWPWAGRGGGSQPHCGQLRRRARVRGAAVVARTRCS